MNSGKELFGRIQDEKEVFEKENGIGSFYRLDQLSRQLQGDIKDFVHPEIHRGGFMDVFQFLKGF